MKSLSPVENVFFQHAPVGVAMISTVSGTILQVNDAYCVLLARAREKIVGFTWMAFTHPEDVSKDVYGIVTMLERKEVRVCRKKRYLRPDGSIVHADVTIAPIPFSGNEPIHMAMVVNESSHFQASEEIRARIGENRETREAIFNSLAVVAQFRDRETGGHLQRTRLYVGILLDNLPYPHPYSRRGLQMIAKASMLHDIGKVGIPDSVLLKEGPLTAGEFELMKTHTTLGVKAIVETMRYLQHDSSLVFAREIAEYHHERWDGSGYPHALKGDRIPLAARVMALADVYDALRSERVYKKSFTHDESLAIIAAERGRHFEPALVDTFLQLERRFDEIYSTEIRMLEKMKTAEEIA